MSAQPDIGEWYRIRGGDQFEVVAIDEDDGTVEVQYFDGTVEELDLGDWESQYTNGDIEEVSAREDFKGSADDDEDAHVLNGHMDGPNIAGGLDGLDLFEAPDSFQFQ
jgi:uncharacterized protein DUF6763